MRFRMLLAPYRTNSSQIMLRYDYQYDIAAMFYNCIRKMNPDLASQIHDRQKYKFFTFSRLEIPKRRATRNGLKILCNDTYLWFSSPNNELVTTIATCLLQSGEVSFGGLKFAVLSADLVSAPKQFNSVETFTTMSPIILRVDDNETKGSGVWDLSPDDERFIPHLLKNLRKRYEVFNEESPSKDVEVLDISNTHQKRIWIKNTSHRAHLLDVKVRGDEDTLRFIYEAGLGEKTAMGFGMMSMRG